MAEPLIGRRRGGASDTTMLIWKVIEASPGTTREQLWKRLEYDIPAGYAMRRYLGDYAQRLGVNLSAPRLQQARSKVLTGALIDMRKLGLVTWEGEGPGRRYTAARQPHYYGNPEAIDVTGTKAAEHMAIAEALRILERKVATRKGPGRPLTLTGQECDAMVFLLAAHRNKPAN